MRLKDVRKELERRNLSADGDRETLESRLLVAVDKEMGLSKDDALDDAHSDGDRPKTAFKFGLVTVPVLPVEKEVVVDDEDCDMDGNEYPPSNELLPFNAEANATKVSVNSRLGERTAPVSRIEDRLGPKGDIMSRLGDEDIMSRLDYGDITQRLEHESIQMGLDESDDMAGDHNGNTKDYEFCKSQDNITKKPFLMNVDGVGVFDEDHKAARARRFASESVVSGSRKLIKIPTSQTPQPSVVEVFQEYDIEKMEERASKLAHCSTHIPNLKKRATRFDEECANELTQVRMAQRKNKRFKRFELGDKSSSEEEEEEGI